MVAVLKQQKRGLISSTFQLKNSPGISSYGYRNLRDLVSFEDLKRKYEEKAIRLMFTPLSISSILIKTLTAFLLFISPHTPMQNKNEASKRKA